ncbi:type II secretion system protein GspL [Shewanella sp. AS16]|uniref:type II secretion system protein GspL n=1 Tax=Shewanella sp. AS16 TaxID=2907625 RepID=UPI001F2912FB|nr:type II secretion system protein GspL [Shewanella sp. AS16]MCE9687838.1 type II secretion system protein GspL [Shewanella sp. AS16]
MTERLFIRLGRTAEQACSWLVWSELEQEIIASGELADANALSSLAERAGNRPVDVLVPASAMTLTQVSLPEKGQRQALRALPFMLEETLADDVDNMHFVVGPRSGDDLSVVAVAHQQMQSWLSWLAEAGIKVKRLVPDCLALPLEQCRWAAMRFGDDCLLRMGPGTGQSVPTSWLPVVLPKLLPADEPVTVAGYSEMSLEGTQMQPQPLELPMQVLAKGILQAPINLLSGLYAPKREYSKQLLIWKNAAIVLALALVLALVNKGLNLYQANGQAAELKAQSEAIFRQLVPNGRAELMRSLLDSQLRSLQGAGNGAEFFTMLQGLEPAFKQVPELKPNSLRFDAARNEMRMQVTAKTYAQIEKFKELVGRRYQLEAGAMNSSEDQVTSTLTLRSK